MPLPSVYDEAELATFMAAELGETGVSLGLDQDALDTLAEAATEVVGLLGGDLSGLTATADLMKIRAIARWQAWLAAWNVAAGRFDLETLKRSQVFAMIERRLAQAERSAARYPEAALALLGQPRGPAIGQLTTVAPVSPPWPGGIDANDPVYTGSPYRRRSVP